MHKAALFALTLLLAGCAAQGTYRQPSQGHAPDPAFHPDSLSARLHAHINAARAAHNVPPLAYREDVQAVGRAHSEDMDRRGYFNHVTPQGVTPSDRMTQAGVTCASSEEGHVRQGVGENLFMLSRYSRMDITESLGRRDTTYVWDTVETLALDITQGWLDSPPHRANLLNPQFQAHGLGVFVGRRHMVYVTQLLC